MALVDDLRDAINLSHAHAWSRATKIPPGPDEPGLVASFLSGTTQGELRKILGSHFGGGVSMQLSSVFTHKTPTVKPAGAPNGVEIGDLLLIRQHFANGPGTPATAGRALLLQAKRSSTPDSGNISSGNPKIQFELYRDWPSFVGRSHLSVGPDGVKGSSWDFKGVSTVAERYGQYLAVYDGLAFNFVAGSPPSVTSNSKSALSSSGYPPSPTSATTWANGEVLFTALPTLPVQCPTDFAKTLEEFVNGYAGIPFVPGSGGSDHWSIFINRMLSVAAGTKYTYTSKSTGVPSGTKRLADISFWSALPFLSLGVKEEISTFFQSLDRPSHLEWPLYKYPEYLFYPQFSAESQFLRDLGNWVGKSSRDFDGRDFPPSEDSDEDPDEGHVPTLILATSGPEMPEGLRVG